MDNTDHISTLIDELDNNLDNLQEALKGILNKSLTDIAAGYPMLDRAKFYILITYAIESAVFSFLRLTGTSAREHPVYRELERVKQYFQKAKLAEVSLQKPAMRLDQAAAGRFIKAALASNEAMAVRNKDRPRTENLDTTNGSNGSDTENSRKRKASAIEETSSDHASVKSHAAIDTVSTLKKADIQPEKDAETSAESLAPLDTSKTETEPALPETSNTTESDEQKAERKKAKKARKKEKKLAKDVKIVENTPAIEESEPPPAKKKQKKGKEKSSTAKS